MLTQAYESSEHFLLVAVCKKFKPLEAGKSGAAGIRGLQVALIVAGVLSCWVSDTPI